MRQPSGTFDAVVADAVSAVVVGVAVRDIGSERGP